MPLYEFRKKLGDVAYVNRFILHLTLRMVTLQQSPLVTAKLIRILTNYIKEMRRCQYENRSHFPVYILQLMVSNLLLIVSSVSKRYLYGQNTLGK